MHAHKCNKEETTSTGDVTGIPKQTKIVNFNLPQHARETLKTELVKFVSLDIRP